MKRGLIAEPQPYTLLAELASPPPQRHRRVRDPAEVLHLLTVRRVAPSSGGHVV
jgi:hypothetical protein